MLASDLVAGMGEVIVVGLLLSTLSFASRPLTHVSVNSRKSQRDFGLLKSCLS